MKETVEKIEDLKKRTLLVRDCLDLNRKKAEIVGLEKEVNETGFWNDTRKAKQVMQKLDNYKDAVNFWEDIEKRIDDLAEIIKIIDEKKDKDILQETKERLEKLGKEFIEHEFEALMSGKYDEANAIMAIHSGAGGVDAQDWSEMVLRMYLRYAEDHKYKTEIVNMSKGEEAGIKSVTFVVSGSYAYGHLKNEAGVHRLVRLSPFNSDNLRQTSFALVEVLPEIESDDEVKIKDDDLKIDTFRASGAGGQHVNKTDSAVRITHFPTKTVVECQNERSQSQNKETAMKILKAMLYKIQQEKEDAEKKELRGEYTSAEWGNQIRSYVLHPYKLVKDHRTGIETTDPEKVLDGVIDGFIEARLKGVVWRGDRK
ncbi:MAG: peptide chain release factor 2 [Patescibacteria group bacterium]|nr:peptide chain release factor 2 [Patescibacteria group bacterium]